MRTLRMGDVGDDVKLLQHLLNTHLRPPPGLRMTGRFGERTRAAVMRVQRLHGLDVDGVAGPRTQAVLGVAPRAVPVPVGTMRESGLAEAWGTVRRWGSEAIEAIGDLFDDDEPTAAGAVARGTAPGAARPAAARPPAARATSLPAAPRGDASGDVDPALIALDTSRSTPWLETARGELHVQEWLRRGESNPRIEEYHRTTRGAGVSDDIAWCASFVNWVLLQAGVRGLNSRWALDWARWGVHTDTPPLGAVITVTRRGGGPDARSGSGSGNHVAFLVGKTDTHLVLLGGNQGQRVSQVRYRIASYRIRGVRVAG